jgi:hypothetical protein
MAAPLSRELTAPLSMLLIGAVLLTAAPALAQERGVAIDVARIAIDEPVDPDGNYTLPSVTVRNPGEGSGSYRMTIQPIEGASAPPPEWFTFTPDEFELLAGKLKVVEITMQVPPDAVGGDYEVLLSAQLVGTGEGARVGAAAAAPLTFAIPTPPEPLAWWWLLLLLLPFAALLWRLTRRYHITMVRRD